MLSFFRVTILPSLLLLLLALGLTLGQGGESRAAEREEPWRIRFLEAAVVAGPLVKLGEVAAPVGDMPPGKWEELAARELWPAPPAGRAVNMTRPRLQEAVVSTLPDLAPYCLFPGSMALQRGGAALGKEDVQRAVVKELTPLLASLPGETTLKDFRLPQYVFLQHARQTLEVETPKKILPGRLSLRLVVRELGGRVTQKFTGSVLVDCWGDVPVAAVALNREDLLEHSQVTFKRMNLATLRANPWDGRGGPWRVMRPLGVDQVIYQNDLANIPTVRKGNVVTLVYEGKNVRLTVRAEALTDGVAGESIPLRNLQSKKEVYGVVRDASTVIIPSAPGVIPK